MYTVLKQVAGLLEDWDAPRHKQRLKEMFSLYTLPLELEQQPDHPLVGLHQAAQSLLLFQVEQYLTKKAMACLVTEAPGLPFLRVTEWFMDEPPAEKVQGIIDVVTPFAYLYPYPTHTDYATGQQRGGTTVTILDYILSPDDFSIWYRLANNFEGFIAADWIPASSVQVMNGAALLNLPLAAFRLS